MKVFKTKSEIRMFLQKAQCSGESIGFVATMGALHQGHLELIKKSIDQNKHTTCSIFVNPTQFNNPQDLKKYPRDVHRDLDLLRKAGCNSVFLPPTDEMYDQDTFINISFGYLEDIMEGKHRPGHFKGVGLIVSKLFNIVRPDRAYFGEKDLQQLTIIQKLNSELDFGIEIVPVPTIREIDGLAMSSRNMLLSTTERIEALDLFKALSSAKDELNSGKSVISVRDDIHKFFMTSSKIELEYFEIVRSDNLKNVNEIVPEIKHSLCIAGNLGKVRLIDNISLN